MKAIIAAGLLLLASGCNAQTEKVNKNVASTAPKETVKPKVDVKVNKQYDEKGNLVAYDSVYTWSYSSQGGTLDGVHADSVMASFKKQLNFNMDFPSFFKSSFDDYFDMGKMMGEMDSLRGSFMRREYSEMSNKAEANNKLQL